MALSRKWVIDLMNQLRTPRQPKRRRGFSPIRFDLEELEKFSDRHGISRAELASRMGGSP